MQTNLKSDQRLLTSQGYRFQDDYVPPLSAVNLRPTRMLVDLCSVFFVIFANYFGVKGVWIRGFFCGDMTIRYPYRESQVKSELLIYFPIFVFFCMIFCIELLVLYRHFEHRIGCNELKIYFLQIYEQMSYSGLAVSIACMHVGMSKMYLSELRPFFIDSCRPMRASGEVITPNSNCSNPYEYITDYTCTRTFNGERLPYGLEDVRMSFISGHSTLASAFFVYYIVYLEKRFPIQTLESIKRIIQMIFAYYALWVAYTRIQDNKHHWQDVIGGLLTGTIVSGLVANLSMNYSQRVTPPGLAAPSCRPEMTGRSSQKGTSTLQATTDTYI